MGEPQYAAPLFHFPWKIMAGLRAFILTVIDNESTSML